MEFQVYINKNKKYLWILKDNQEKTILVSAIEYNTEKEATHAIDIMVKNKKKYRGVAILENREQELNKWIWTIQHDNNNIVARSPDYFKSKIEAQNNIFSLINIIRHKIRVL